MSSNALIRIKDPANTMAEILTFFETEDDEEAPLLRPMPEIVSPLLVVFIISKALRSPLLLHFFAHCIAHCIAHASLKFFKESPRPTAHAVRPASSLITSSFILLPRYYLSPTKKNGMFDAENNSMMPAVLTSAT